SAAHLRRGNASLPELEACPAIVPGSASVYSGFALANGPDAACEPGGARKDRADLARVAGETFRGDADQSLRRRADGSRQNQIDPARRVRSSPKAVYHLITPDVDYESDQRSGDGAGVVVRGGSDHPRSAYHRRVARVQRLSGVSHRACEVLRESQ